MEDKIEGRTKTGGGMEGGKTDEWMVNEEDEEGWNMRKTEAKARTAYRDV